MFDLTQVDPINDLMVMLTMTIQQMMMMLVVSLLDLVDVTLWIILGPEEEEQPMLVSEDLLKRPVALEPRPLETHKGIWPR